MSSDFRCITDESPSTLQQQQIPILGGSVTER